MDLKKDSNLILSENIIHFALQDSDNYTMKDMFKYIVYDIMGEDERQFIEKLRPILKDLDENKRKDTDFVVLYKWTSWKLKPRLIKKQLQRDLSLRKLKEA
mmetsp:Transcript_7348/g.6578  ORF Transcript_7348/g.6578 Transcript_7348/m.6578 type:complete len:101 (-) Transcript_7348:1429-1731(-)